MMASSRIHPHGLTPREWHRTLGFLLPIVVAFSQIEPATSQAPNRTNATVDGHDNDDNPFHTTLSPILSAVSFVVLIIVCGGYLKVLGCCHSGWWSERNHEPTHPPDAPFLPSQLAIAVMPHVTHTALGFVISPLDINQNTHAMLPEFVRDYITSDPPATDPITLRPVGELLGDPTVNRAHLIVYVSGGLEDPTTRLRVLYIDGGHPMLRNCPITRQPITHAMTWDDFVSHPHLPAEIRAEIQTALDQVSQEVRLNVAGHPSSDTQNTGTATATIVLISTSPQPNSPATLG